MFHDRRRGLGISSCLDLGGRSRAVRARPRGLKTLVDSHSAFVPCGARFGYWSAHRRKTQTQTRRAVLGFVIVSNAQTFAFVENRFREKRISADGTFAVHTVADALHRSSTQSPKHGCSGERKQLNGAEESDDYSVNCNVSEQTEIEGINGGRGRGGEGRCGGAEEEGEGDDVWRRGGGGGVVVCGREGERVREGGEEGRREVK